jgi:transcriptional regulator with XRE-family HTH domain
MSQRALAAELGVNSRYICSIEQGRKGLSLDKLVIVCKCFGTSMADILPIEDPESLEIKEQLIRDITDACRAMDITQVGFLKALLYSFRV